MLKVGDFLKYIIASRVDSTFLRAFIVYFQHSMKAEEFLAADHLNHFIRHALHYPHWQQQRPFITAELQEVLSPLWSENLISFAPAEIQWPESIQVLEIENTTEWLETLQKYLNKASSSNGAETRLVQDTPGTALGFILQENRELEVHHFNRQMTLRRGLLEPLRKDLILHYTKELDLSPQYPQKWEIAPYSVAHFFVQTQPSSPAQLSGAVFRGHSFQLQHSFDQALASQIPHLFWALRRAEQHFTSRESDPFYQNLLATIEAAALSIRIGEVNSHEKAAEAMAQAQNALEMVFVGDKLLTLLIRDLQHTLELRQPDVRSRQEVVQRVSVSRARDFSPSRSDEKKSAPITHRNRPSEVDL